MTAEAPDDTRTRILRAALDLFAEHGYQRTRCARSPSGCG